MEGLGRSPRGRQNSLNRTPQFHRRRGRRNIANRKNSTGGKYGKTYVQIILRWHIKMGYIIFPKSTNPDHIASNIDIFDFELTSGEMDQIAALNKGKLFFTMPEWVAGCAPSPSAPESQTVKSTF